MSEKKLNKSDKQETKQHKTMTSKNESKTKEKTTTCKHLH